MHLFPERLVDDRVVFTGIALFLVHDFAAVDAVLQKVIERAAGQGLAARLAAVAVDPNLAGDAVPLEPVL